jgi:cathepsin A (carboxypeptidase C)
MGINLKFHTDWMKDFSGYVADLLNAGIPALIYAGDVDFICNYLGNRGWTLTLPWQGSADFTAATDHDWKGKGLARSAKGFTFLQVYDAGHMVPTDQPQVALDMIQTFVTGGTF